MTGLPSELYNRCRTTLLKCSEFDNNASLRTIFITGELHPFRNRLPSATSKNARVDACLAFLVDKRLSDGRAVLPLFLTALRDRYQPGDALRNELAALAQDTWSHLDPSEVASSEESSSSELRSQGSTYITHIDRAEGIAIGNGAQVIQQKPSSPQDAEPSPPARGDTSSASASQELPGPIQDRWALLVGVNRYVDPTFPPLKFCVNDVLALEATLKDLGYTVVTLYDNAAQEHLRPTRDNVEAELTRLCQVAGPDDLLLVHFACHGKLVDGKPVLITRETRAPTLARRALPLAEVERMMRDSEARRLVLTLDACHTGVEVGRDLADPEFIRNAYELAEGFALIAASTAQQIAQEWDEKEHGVFTYYLLEGLSGQADHDDKDFVTVGDLSLHVLNGLKHWNVEHAGLLQEPTARAEGLGDIIVADYRHKSSNPNPFVPLTGRIIDPARVFDREREIRHTVEFLQAGSSVALIGPAAVGKSSLLTKLLTILPERLGTPWEAAYLDMQPIFNEDEFFTALCDALRVDTCRGYALNRALQGRRILLALDEVDKMAWEGFTRGLRAELRGLAGDATAPLKLLLTARVPLDRLFDDSDGNTSPLENICLQIDVKPWDEDTARAFLIERLPHTEIVFEEKEMAWLIEQSNGHPQQLTLAAYKLFACKMRGDL
jgi:hypothetical protein